MNTKIKTCLAVASLGALLMSAPALAQQAGGVKIGGDAKITGQGSDITTTAENESTASTGIAVVRGNTEVKGDVDIYGKAEAVTTTATGKSCAETTIGGIGQGPCK